jgi:hypothetical protein
VIKKTVVKGYNSSELFRSNNLKIWKFWIRWFPEYGDRAVGLTLADDEPTVFIMDKKLEMDESVELNVETLGDLDVKIYTNTSENNNFELKSTEEIAKDLVNYDNILPY